MCVSQKYGIASNDSFVADSALEASRRVVAVLSDEAVPWKNLGALHQHLMNVVSDGKSSRDHMGAMVRAYSTFVKISRGIQHAHSHHSHELTPPDPDVDILDKWVSEVVAWMQEQPESS